MTRVTVLFTGAGRRVELLRAFRSAHAALGLEGKILAVDADPLAPALRVAHGTELVPRSSDSAYVPRLVSLCEDQGVSIVFPVIDHDIPILAATSEAFASVGTRLATMGSESVRTVSDKWETALFLRRIGVAGPDTWLPGELEAEPAVTFPLFVKPRFGSGSKHTARVDRRDELDTFVSRCPDPIIQQFLEGPEITCDLAYSLDGRFLGMCQRQRIETRTGEVQKGFTVWDERIAEACLAVGDALAARGPITVQCLFHGGRPVFTEINGRFGGGLPLAIAAGLDFPRWYLALCAGLEVQIPPPGSYRRGLYITRYDESFFLTDPHAGDPGRTLVERGPWHSQY